MVEFLQDRLVHDLLAVLEKRKTMRGIPIAHNDRNKTSLILAHKTLGDSSPRVGFYMTCDAIDTHTCGLRQFVSLVRKRMRDKDREGNILAYRTDLYSEIITLRRLVDEFHLDGTTLRHIIRDAIARTLKPWQYDAEERLDGPDRYTPQERIDYKEHYDFDVATLGLYQKATDLAGYDLIKKTPGLDQGVLTVKSVVVTMPDMLN